MINGQLQLVNLAPPYITLIPLSTRLPMKPFQASFQPNNVVSIGRAKEASMFIDCDTSVSRMHAALIMEGKRVFIKDLNSKFGTSVIKKIAVLKGNERIFVQVKNYLIEFRTMGA